MQCGKAQHSAYTESSCQIRCKIRCLLDTWLWITIETNAHSVRASPSFPTRSRSWQAGSMADHHCWRPAAVRHRPGRVPYAQRGAPASGGFICGWRLGWSWTPAAAAAAAGAAPLSVSLSMPPAGGCQQKLSVCLPGVSNSEASPERAIVKIDACGGSGKIDFVKCQERTPVLLLCDSMGLLLRPAALQGGRAWSGALADVPARNCYERCDQDR